MKNGPPVHCHDDNDDHSCTVQFSARVHQGSSHAFLCNSTSEKEEVERFFASPRHRHLFLTAGGKNKCEKVELTPELLAEWTTRCQSQHEPGSTGTTTATTTTHFPTRLPDESDEVYAVQTSGMKIPGLTVEVWVTVGIQRLQEHTPPPTPSPTPSIPPRRGDNDSESAEDSHRGGARVTLSGSSQTVYLVTLIGEKRQAKGLRFFTYLYNKMTGGSRRSHSAGQTTSSSSGGESGGGGGDPHNSSTLSHTECTTKIGYTFWDHHDDPGHQPLTSSSSSSSSYVTFEMSTEFLLTLQFPKVVLRILPTSQEKAQAQGSKAIATAIRKDSQQAMSAFEAAYHAAYPTTTTIPNTTKVVMLS